MTEYRILRQLAADRRERDRVELCSTYPGPLDSYKYVPPRCISSAPHAPRRGRQRREDIAQQIDDNYRAMLVNTQAQLRAKVTELGPRALIAKERLINTRVQPGEGAALVAETAYELLAILPSFMVDVARLMLDPAAATENPLVDNRFNAVTLLYEEGDSFRNSVVTRHAAYTLVLNHLNNLLH